VHLYPVKNKLFKILLICIVFSVSFCSNNKDLVVGEFKNFKGRYLLFIQKGDYSLSVYNRNLDVVEKFSIGYGSNTDKKSKIHEGDNRTPEGIYYINEILSMDFNSDSLLYKKLERMNKTYFSVKNGHSKFGLPGTDLGYNVYGARYFGLNYPNENDLKSYSLNISKGLIEKIKGKCPGIGSGIAIHGNADENSIGELSSNGCIRMYNSDIVKLDNFIEIGTPVIIVSTQ